MVSYIIFALVCMCLLVSITALCTRSTIDYSLDKELKGKNSAYANMVKSYKLLPNRILSDEESVSLVYKVLEYTGHLSKSYSNSCVNIIDSISDLQPKISLKPKSKYCGHYTTILCSSSEDLFYEDIRSLAKNMQPEAEFLTHSCMKRKLNLLPNYSFSSTEDISVKLERHIIYYSIIDDIEIKDKIASVINMLIRTSNSGIKPYDFLTVWPDGIDPTVFEQSVYSKYID